MFETIDVSDWEDARPEQMGTKRKIWLRKPAPEGVKGAKWLFKYRFQYETSKIYRDDDWSEKLAAEVAELLGVPHARVELASRRSERGVISRDLVGSLGAIDLIQGNRALSQYIAEYPADSDEYRNSDHTLGRVLEVLGRLKVAVADGTPTTDALRTAGDVFCGYLMLDALIGNTDRNPGNWGVLQYSASPFADLRLCPSFDHASCLGYRETDGRRDSILAPSDGVAKYVRKAYSALYRTAEDKKSMTTHEAFETAAQIHPAAARYWVARVGQVSYPELTDIVAQVPPAIMSDPARQFALAILRTNRDTLLGVEIP